MHASPASTDALTIAILLFDDVEVLDFCGPFEVFSVAARLARDTFPESAVSWRVFTIAQHARMITARGNLLVQPHYGIADHPSIDVLIVPGGWGTRREVENTGLIRWIANVAQDARITASVCTGAFLLARAGLLSGRSVTTHWASLDRLATDVPECVVRRDVRWVDEGSVVTSAGISAGIDMSLHLVERLLGREMAAACARHMEYTWQDAR